MTNPSLNEQPTHDPVARFRPLAQLALGAKLEAPWTELLAQLYEAASRGIGHLSLSALKIDADLSEIPEDIICIQDGRAMLPRMAQAWAMHTHRRESAPPSRDEHTCMGKR